jgi:hypothetical protein
LVYFVAVTQGFQIQQNPFAACKRYFSFRKIISVKQLFLYVSDVVLQSFGRLFFCLKGAFFRFCLPVPVIIDHAFEKGHFPHLHFPFSLDIS